MKAFVAKLCETQKLENSNNKKEDLRRKPQLKNFIQNDEWRKKAKTKLDLELFEIHLLDFGSSG
jgi:hypothetical protein